ncbi:MAG TPA: OmpH family outer membrane protein [Ferruginibacter sp.]|nr:OmpH family outer membrane protein [Ferruginibacter sp.]
MKKFFTVATLILTLSFTNRAQAQQVKIGYISVDAMVSLMPEALSLDSLLGKYQSDTLNPKYAELVTLYKYKDSVFRDTIHKAPDAMRKQLAGEIPTLIYQIQNWDQISRSATENKQNMLLAPAYRKVYDAIRAVAKEKAYTHVANKEAFIIAPFGDDMTLMVAAKLNVKVPPQMSIGLK